MAGKLTDFEKRVLKLNTGIAHQRQVTLFFAHSNGAQLNNTIFFDDQQDLRYARILGIEVIAEEDINKSQPLAYTLVPAAALKYMAITLETNDADLQDAIGNQSGRFRSTNQNIHWQPLVTFHRTIGYGAGNVIGVRVCLNLIIYL